MLRLCRRHRLSCTHTSERYRRCSCPIYVKGTLAGERIKKSLDLTSWEAASDLVRQWETSGQIGKVKTVIPPIADAVAPHRRDAPQG